MRIFRIFLYIYSAIYLSRYLQNPLIYRLKDFRKQSSAFKSLYMYEEIQVVVIVLSFVGHPVSSCSYSYSFQRQSAQNNFIETLFKFFQKIVSMLNQGPISVQNIPKKFITLDFLFMFLF